MGSCSQVLRGFSLVIGHYPSKKYHHLSTLYIYFLSIPLTVLPSFLSSNTLLSMTLVSPFLPPSGEEGVYNVLKLLNDELVLAMKLAGCVNLTDLKPAMIRTALSFQSRL